MEDSKLTIKNTYNEYKPQDFQYGDIDSTNLNPKREVKFDQLDKIAIRLQEITDDIIRKRIIPSQEVEQPIRASAGGESIPKGIPFPKQELLAKIGSDSSLIFPIINSGNNPNPLENLLETIIGTFPIPELLNEIESPIQLDCEAILKQYEFEEDFADETDEDDSNNLNSENISENNQDDDNENDDSSEDDNDDDNNEDDELERELEECAEIEIGWLKILLILVKVIKIIQLIISLVLSIIIPIIEILRLAIGAWLNPPNIEFIKLRIIQMVMAIVLLLLSLLLQLIWNLLNFDCICDQSAQIIEQIRQAMSMFSSTLGVFNPTAVNLLTNKVNDEIMDPLNEIIQTASAKKEAWAKIGETYKAQFAELGDPNFRKNMMQSVAESMKDGIINNPQVGQVAGLIQQGQQLVGQAQQDVMKVSNDAKEAWAKITNPEIKKSNPAASMLASDQFLSLTMIPKKKV